MSVYLLHFDPPLGHATHYVGWATHVVRRYQRHCSGDGARITQVAVERGIKLHLVRIWRGESRRFERLIKQNKYGPRWMLCPRCCKERGEPLHRLRTLRFTQRRRWPWKRLKSPLTLDGQRTTVAITPPGRGGRASAVNLPKARTA